MPALVRRQIRRNRLGLGAKLSGFALLASMACKSGSTDTRDAGALDASAPQVDEASVLAQLAEVRQRRAFDAQVVSALSDARARVRQEAVETLAVADDAEAQRALVRALVTSDLELLGHLGVALSVSFRTLDAPSCEALTLALARVRHEAQGASARRGLARALAGCEDAEPTLRALFTQDADAAGAALARRARSRKNLQSATFDAVLDTALPAGDAPLQMDAFAPLLRVPWPEAARARLRAAVARVPYSVEGVRLLGQAGMTRELSELVTRDEGPPQVVLEVLRKLGSSPAASATFAKVLRAQLPSEPLAAWLPSARAAMLAHGIELAPSPVQGELREVLASIAAWKIDGAVDEARLRRLEHLRCEAGARVAGSAFDSAPVFNCAREGSEEWERARLRVLARWPFRGGRLAHYEAALHSKHLRVREAALALIAEHPEVQHTPIATRAVAAALRSSEQGEVIAALELNTDVQREDLDVAFSRAWPEDASELFSALLQYAKKSPSPSGAALAAKLVCHAAQPVRRLARELAQASEPCASLLGAAPKARGRNAVLTLRGIFGTLTIKLDADAAPSSVAELTRLAQSGFYQGLEMHRVVPGFVAQFGDLRGDGYGGGGRVLLHEPSAHPFDALTVGLAHAGFDTASAQLFVTTNPARHLDVDYTWVGTAEGPWLNVVQGDRIEHAELAFAP